MLSSSKYSDAVDMLLSEDPFMASTWFVGSIMLPGSALPLNRQSNYRFYDGQRNAQRDPILVQQEEGGEREQK